MFELEVWQAPITDNQGNILPGAQITVFNSDDTVATIYDDLDRKPKANPFNVGTDALARFYAEPGRYRVQAQSGTDIAVYENVDLSQKSIREDLNSPAGGTLVKLANGKSVQEYSNQFSDENLQAAITDAEAAADRAETAAEQAYTAGRIYETSAAGQADTELVDGDYFLVVSADSDEVFELWRKGASAPNDTGKRTSGASYTDKQVARVYQPLTVLSGNNRDMLGANDYTARIGSFPFDVNNTVAGELFVDFSTAGVNYAAGITDSLEADKTYYVELDVTVQSGTPCEVLVGRYSSGPSHSNTLRFTPSGGKKTHKGYFTTTSAGTAFDIGVLGASNAVGFTMSIDNVKVFEKGSNQLTEYLSSSSVKDSQLAYDYVKGADSDMSAANGWQGLLGSPVFDVNHTRTGELYFDLSGAQAGANKAIVLYANLQAGQRYEIHIDAQLLSGVAAQFRMGEYSSSGTPPPSTFAFTPTDEKTTFKGYIVANEDNFRLVLGVLGSANPSGGEYAFDNVILRAISEKEYEQDQRITSVESGSAITPVANSFYTEQFLQSLSRFDKPLTKIAVAGDSLMANAYGGAPPEDEGAGRWPMRLDVNTIPRRIYDLLSWNKPQHRRLDDVDWTLDGTWTTVNDSSVWVGFHAQEKYHTSVDPNAYAEITIPAGIENFAFIGHRRNNMGVVDITLNGGSIAAHGPTEVDFNRPSTHTAETGSPYYTIEYNDLPAGANTIRIAKRADSSEVRLWGGFHWSGTTMMLYVVAQGGHTMQNLISQGHFVYDVVENDMDAILFETTVMNEASEPRSVTQSKDDLQFIIDNYFSGKDYMLMNPFPFGDNGSGTNFYTLYDSPTMEETCNGLREVAYSNSSAFVNVFDIFRQKVENRGGTLVGGETGLWYTTDGQHPNTDGAREWFNAMRFSLENKPIRYEG